MKIEFIGCTSAGKSTLIEQLVRLGQSEELNVVDSDQYLLGSIGHKISKRRSVRAVLIHAVALVGLLAAPFRNLSFVWFTLRSIASKPIPIRQRINQFRKTLKNLGCFEILSLRDRASEMLIIDEGTIHTAHYLFVHADGELEREEIDRFAEHVPLPDVVVCLRHSVAELVRRTIARGHRRVPNGNQPITEKFIWDAVNTFDWVSRHARIASRVIVIDDRQIILPAAHEKDPAIVQVLKVLQAAFPVSEITSAVQATHVISLEQEAIAQ